MPWTEALTLGLGGVFSWPGILIPVAGTLLAMIASFLPGVGNASLAAVLLVVTVGWDNESVLLLFGALTGGATFMGSITAILFNIPGNVASTPTLLDGYPLAQRGYPRAAIACAATASAVGSLIGVLVLVVTLPVIRPFLLSFGPLERLLIGFWGLLTIVSMPTSSYQKALAMALLGLVAAMIGVDPGTGIPRWEFGSLALSQGFGLIPMLLGLFTIAELISWLKAVSLPAERLHVSAPDDSISMGWKAVFRYPKLVCQSSVIGTLIGMVPGVGGTVAGFIAYGQAVRSAGDQVSDFGKGDIRGLLAPEAAVDAKDGGSLLPALAFGLPGSEAGVLLLAAFATHGIVPGQQMLDNQLPLVFILIGALLFSNLLTSLLGMALIPGLVKLRNLRIDRIALPCLIVSLLALVQLNSQLFDVYTALGFGLLGYFLRRYDWPRVPFVIAFVLGGLIENNLLITVQLVDLGRVSLFNRPVSIALVVLSLVSLYWLLSTRSKIPLKTKVAGTDAVIASVFFLCTGVLAVTAFTEGMAYSLYARTIIFLTSGVVLFVLLRSIVGLRRDSGRTNEGNAEIRNPSAKDPNGVEEREGHRRENRAENNARVRQARKSTLMKGTLQLFTPPEEHRRPLLAILLLGPMAALAGYSMAMGVASFLWLLPRQGAAPVKYLVAGLSGIGIGVFCWYFVNNIANLVLPAGILWSLAG